MKRTIDFINIILSSLLILIYSFVNDDAVILDLIYKGF